MATFVLIHGGGDVGWSWHLVEEELRAHGHHVVAPDLPCEDDAAGFPEYADTVIEALGDRRDVVVVGHSLGGYTATLVADRIQADLLILVTAMVPAPGEKGEDWFANTGWEPTEGDDRAVFYADVPPDLAEEALRRGRDQSGTPGAAPWPLASWPAVPTRFVLCTEDRFFPPDFMRRVVADRLGIVPDEIAASHCVALSRPKELVGMFLDHLDQLASTSG